MSDADFAEHVRRNSPSLIDKWERRTGREWAEKLSIWRDAKIGKVEEESVRTTNYVFTAFLASSHEDRFILSVVPVPPLAQPVTSPLKVDVKFGSNATRRMSTQSLLAPMGKSRAKYQETLESSESRGAAD
jgi:hypothetical protein